MLNQFNKNKTEAIASSTIADNEGNWITDHAWISGVVGAILVVGCAIWYSRTGMLSTGLHIFGKQITTQRTDTVLAVIITTTLSMAAVETIRLWLWNRPAFFNIHPRLKSGKYLAFIGESINNYLLYLALLWLAIAFFHTAGEYGFKKHAPYYQGWFRFLELVWTGYLWLGLPYVILTRALKHSPDNDRRDLGYFLGKLGRYALSRLPLFRHLQPRFAGVDKKIARGILVKLFFTPLMTVFFLDQFPHLVNNIGYISEGLLNAIENNHYSHARFNRDFFNISISFIFSIDVALAWCGYVVSSRWVDNQTFSAEPTLLGWAVCIICYPPFQMILGLYYAAPGEREVLHFSHQWLVSLFTGMMVLSYFVYMSATLWFGVRFSNLTNRGIIRTGPFAVIRHPAYASKNFSWWCVMFPAILYNAAHTDIDLAIAQTLGLVLMTWVYYLRAITEERHLDADPAYQKYCEQVPHRFIPRVV